MNWADIGSHLFATIVAGSILGICGFFLWLWKRSVYGRLDSLEKAVESFGKEFTEKLDDAKSAAERNVMEAKVLAERGLSEIKNDVNDAKLIATRGVAEVKLALQEDYVPLRLCNSERDGCQKVLLSEMHGIIAKLDMVIKRQDTVIARMDRHMNGHGAEKDGER